MLKRRVYTLLRVKGETENGHSKRSKTATHNNLTSQGHAQKLFDPVLNNCALSGLERYG